MHPEHLDLVESLEEVEETESVTSGKCSEWPGVLHHYFLKLKKLSPWCHFLFAPWVCALNAWMLPTRLSRGNHPRLFRSQEFTSSQSTSWFLSEKHSEGLISIASLEPLAQLSCLVPASGNCTGSPLLPHLLPLLCPAPQHEGSNSLPVILVPTATTWDMVGWK